MKQAVMTALLAFALTAFAQESGEKRVIDGQRFTYDGKVWTHDILEKDERTTQTFSAVRGDYKWEQWYREGDDTARKIMDLRPNAVFKYMGEDGRYHIYGVFTDRPAFVAAVGAAPAKAKYTVLGMSPATAAIVGGAAIATVVILGDDGAQDEVSPTRR